MDGENVHAVVPANTDQRLQRQGVLREVNANYTRFVASSQRYAELAQADLDKLQQQKTQLRLQLDHQNNDFHERHVRINGVLEKARLENEKLKQKIKAISILSRESLAE